MTEKEVRMDLVSEHHGGACGEIRIHLMLGSPARVRIRIAKASSGSFEGDLSLREFLELLDLQSTIARSVRGQVAVEDAAERQVVATENNLKRELQVDQVVAAIDRMAVTWRDLALALTPAPKAARKVRGKGRVRR